MYFFCALSRTLLHRKRQGISFQNIPCPSPCVHFNLLIILFLLIMIDQQSNHCKYCNSDNPCERILIPFCFCSFYILPGCLTAVLCVRVFHPRIFSAFSAFAQNSGRSPALLSPISYLILMSFADSNAWMISNTL